VIDLMTASVSAKTAHTVSLLTPAEAFSDQGLISRWRELMNLLDPVHSVFASPVIYEQFCREDALGQNRVAVIRDASGDVVGVCPIVRWRLEMPFTVRRYQFGKFVLEAATILSRQPLVPDDPAVFQLLFEGLLGQLDWCDCIFADSIPIDCPVSRFIYSTSSKRLPFLVYPPRPEPREWIYLEMDDSLDKFLATKQKRTRNTLKRRLKKLTEKGGGSLECTLVEHEDQVDDFYRAAALIAEKSWQFHSFARPEEETALSYASLQQFARIGCLRAYLLSCGGRPCAFVIGYQYEDVLQLEQTAYLPEFALYSPGTVLYYLVMQDLYRHRRPRFVNHGTGVTPHKVLFSNRTSPDACLYLFRPTFRNRIRCWSHRRFYSALKLAERWVRKPRSKPRAIEDDNE
jgi:CelD/BcsL family acetyltransferase involved in cellulose biosynthesis